MDDQYECPFHKIYQEGSMREDFSIQFYDLLLWIPMRLSMKLYKEVNVACHCKSNYDAFDSILKEIKLNLKESEQTQSKDADVNSGAR